MDTPKERMSIFYVKTLNTKTIKKLLQKIWKLWLVSVLKLLCQIQKNKTIIQRQKQWFKNIYIAYKNGNTNIICSMIGKKPMSRSKKKKLIEVFLQEKI